MIPLNYNYAVYRLLKHILLSFILACVSIFNCIFYSICTSCKIDVRMLISVDLNCIPICRTRSQIKFKLPCNSIVVY